MIRRLILVVPIVLGATLVTGVTASQAATHHSAVTAAKKSKGHGYAGFAKISKGQKAHAAPRAGSSSSAQTTFTVPTLACTATDSGVIVGSGIFSSVSNWVSAGGVVVACQDGAPSFGAEAVVNNDPTTLDMTPAPGDTVTTSVVIVPGETQVTVDDVTQDVSLTTTVEAGSVGTYLSDGIDAVRTPAILPVPNFGTITFTHASFNGQTLRKEHPKPVSRKSGKTVEIKTSKLNPTGDGFTETYKNP
jgi:hypothetical protein